MPTPAEAVRAVRELGLRPIWMYARYQLLLRSGWLQLRTPVSSWEREETLFERSLVRMDPSMQRAYGLFDLRRPEMARLQTFLTQNAPEITLPAEEILSGKFSFFGQAAPLEVGFPPEWNRQPAFDSYPQSEPIAADLHWSQTATSNVTDIKVVWELSRFSWAYTLGRAYAASGEVRYWEAFWALFESWCAANAPNAGPQWISGQEVALRLLAVVFASDVFAPLLETQPDRELALRVFLAVHASRLPHTLLYARAQENNHLVSDALGLYAAGLVLREHRSAARWRSLGRRWLIRALDEQVFPDGGYVQHSHTYARLVLQEGLLAASLAEFHDEQLPHRTLDALQRMARLLHTMADTATGGVPNFGSNDGALLLPLTVQPVGDFRPTVQAAFTFLEHRAAFHSGPWDELALWLGAGQTGGLETGNENGEQTGREDGRRAVKGILAKDGEGGCGEDLSFGSASFPQAGLYMMSGGGSRAVLRCARFTNRPNHSDQLHLDLWWNGQALAADAGTYLYNAPQPWENSLVGASVHNTVTLNNRDPMHRAGRFLLLDRAQASIRGRYASVDGRFELLTAEHDGYQRMGLVHRRSVLRVDAIRWMVVDDVLPMDGRNRENAEVRLSWLLPDPVGTNTNTNTDADADADENADEVRYLWKSHGVELATKHGLARLEMWCEGSRDRDDGEQVSVSRYRAGELVGGPALEGANPAWGWISSTYGEKHPADMLIACITGETPLRLVSSWTLGNEPLPGMDVEWRGPGESGCVLGTLRVGDAVWTPDLIYGKSD